MAASLTPFEDTSNRGPLRTDCVSESPGKIVHLCFFCTNPKRDTTSCIKCGVVKCCLPSSYYDLEESERPPKSYYVCNHEEIHNIICECSIIEILAKATKLSHMTNLRFILGYLSPSKMSSNPVGYLGFLRRRAFNFLTDDPMFPIWSGQIIVSTKKTKAFHKFARKRLKYLLRSLNDKDCYVPESLIEPSSVFEFRSDLLTPITLTNPKLLFPCFFTCFNIGLIEGEMVAAMYAIETVLNKDASDKNRISNKCTLYRSDPLCWDNFIEVVDLVEDGTASSLTSFIREHNDKDTLAIYYVRLNPCDPGNHSEQRFLIMRRRTKWVLVQSFMNHYSILDWLNFDKPLVSRSGQILIPEYRGVKEYPGPDLVKLGQDLDILYASGDSAKTKVAEAYARLTGVNLSPLSYSSSYTTQVVRVDMTRIMVTNPDR